MSEEIIDFDYDIKKDMKIETLLTKEFSLLKKMKKWLEKIYSTNDKELLDKFYKKIGPENSFDRTVIFKMQKSIIKCIADLNEKLHKLSLTNPEEERKIHAEVKLVSSRATEFYLIVGFKQKLETLIKESKEDFSKVEDALKMTNEAIYLNKLLVKEFKEMDELMNNIKKKHLEKNQEQKNKLVFK